MIGSENTSQRELPIYYTVKAILANLALLMFICKEKDFNFPFAQNNLERLLPCLDAIPPPQLDLDEPESPWIYMGPGGQTLPVVSQAGGGQVIISVLEAPDSSGIYMGPVGHPLPEVSQAGGGQVIILVLGAPDSLENYMYSSSGPTLASIITS